MNAAWTAADSNAAKAQGWDVFEIWDQDTTRLYLEIQHTDSKSADDEKVRQFVYTQAQLSNTVAIKALRAVYQSKVVPPPTSTQRKS